ncbi:MAG: nitrophenyl compound nitroreductase subunit ArsF family protein [Bacteroidales bacterium]
MRTRILFVFMAMLFLLSCGGGTAKKEASQAAATEKSDRVEVLYFHGKQRCITCNAIEKLTQEVIETDFPEALADGDLVFKVIDISDAANEAVADRYEVTWASLFVNKWDGDAEVSDNLTEFGFTYAKSSPDVFKEGVRSKIKTLLSR